MPMTDEIKKVENETPKDEPKKALSEQTLDQVVAGTRPVEKASPALMLVCANGTHMGNATKTN
jgi:type VI protein secretion system component Hcp